MRGAGGRVRSGRLLGAAVIIQVRADSDIRLLGSLGGGCDQGLVAGPGWR